MATKAALKKSTAPAAEFQEVFDALKAILKPYASKLEVVADTPSYYCLQTREAVWRGRRCMFAAVKTGKNYVSYHLVSVYMNKAYGAQMSPELEKRQQGKGCFNFKRPDATLFAELKRLTEAGAEGFRSGKLFEMAKTMRCD